MFFHSSTTSSVYNISMYDFISNQYISFSGTSSNTGKINSTTTTYTMLDSPPTTPYNTLSNNTYLLCAYN